MVDHTTPSTHRYKAANIYKELKIYICYGLVEKTHFFVGNGIRGLNLLTM